MFNSNWKDDFYLFQSCDTAPISNSSLETVCFFHRECPSVPQRDVEGQPLVIFTPLTPVRRTRPHKTITRAHRPSRGRDRSSLAPALLRSCVCLPRLRRHKRRMIARSSFSWNRLSDRRGFNGCEMFICERLHISERSPLLHRDQNTSDGYRPSLGNSFYVTSGMCQRSLARFPEEKKKKGKGEFWLHKWPANAH